MVTGPRKQFDAYRPDQTAKYERWLGTHMHYASTKNQKIEVSLPLCLYRLFEIGSFDEE